MVRLRRKKHERPYDLRSMDPYKKNLIKEAQRELLTEWLESTYARVGKWTVSGLKALLFYIVIWLITHFVVLKVGNFSVFDIFGSNQNYEHAGQVVHAVLQKVK